MAVLGCLGRSMTEPDLPVQLVLRMQGNAVKLNTMAEKSRKALAARQRERIRGRPALPAATQLNEAEFLAAIGKALDMQIFARTKLEAHQIGKALTQSVVADQAASEIPAPLVAPPVLAEPMTPDVLFRRTTVDRMWARELGELAPSNRRIMH
jgi:hypothetical protein